MRGVRSLWTAVMTSAAKDSVKKLPAKDSPLYRLARLDKASAKRFFKDPTSNLGLACSVLDMHEGKVRSVGSRLIEAAERTEA